MEKSQSNSAGFYFLMVLAMAGWGGSWVSAKVIAGLAAPELLVFLRYLITAIAFLPILIMRKESFRVDRKTLALLVISAALYVSYSQFFFRGLQTGLAGAGGVLLTTTNPLITYILSALIFRVRPSKNEIIGLLLGLVGGVFLLKLWQFDMNQLIMSGNLYFLIAAGIWSAIALFSHESQKSVSLFLYSFYINGLAGFIGLPFVSLEQFQSIPHFSVIFYGNVLYLALIGTAFSTTVYFLSTKKLGASKGSSFIFLVPVFAVVLSYFFLGEKPSIPTIIGGTITIAAVWIIQKRKRT